jgi:flagellar basal body rod protein FlgG
MISQATAEALARVAERAADVRHAYEAGFEPSDASSATRDVAPARTLDPLSVVAPAESYFVVAGRDGPRFTRDGGFSLVEGELRARDGAAVLGYARDGAPLAPVRIESVDAALGRASDVRLERDGSLTYARTALDPRSGARRVERVVAGRLALAAFPAGTQIVRADETHVSAPPGVRPSYSRPGEGGSDALQTHARDLGRIDPLTGVRRLQEAYMALDALHAAGYAADSLDRAALDLVK